ncbi:MAG TPA: class I SAM-dependent methyltransferase [Thermoleophilaceae bacterium]|nr:class I SAM-dependent methyltransferase [Thermoleophilaceae bacterium]
MLRRLYDATWGRMFALGYDRFQQRSEALGVREQRARFLSEARGRCLEIGSGTGLNLDRWPEVDELVLSEPDPHMAARLRRKVAAGGRRAEVVEAPAEDLPFPDGSFDTVAVTYVLCTVPDVPAALREIDRVLRPGGRLLFLEHVRSPDPGLARWQDRLHGPWYLFGNGCHCNRDTLAAIGESPLELERAERGEVPGAVPLVKPMVTGSARRA